jgi:Bacterial membrane protein YfhO
VAGPLLIVASVLVVMHGFWLSPKLTNQQVDLLAFWFPRWCALGTSLAHAHIPTWLPNQFGGVPFASDPQSGWLYLPVMLLFITLSCARAFGLFIVLQPVLAGLGLYWFFRNEGLGRPAATVGGLTLALSMSGSVVALSLPFAGMLAWTAMTLAAVSGFLHARTLPGRMAWFVFAELSLSQIAAAHLTDGLLIGAGIVGLYMLARSFVQVRARERSLGSAAFSVVAVFAAFPVLSAGILLPRLDLLSRTPIGYGYVKMGQIANQLSGTNGPPPIYFRGVGPWWGTSFARGPGGYVGAVAILLVPAALWSRRWRVTAGAFALGGLAGWVLNLDTLIASSRVRTFVLAHRIGELWLRSPYRFRYLLVVAFAALAGYGTQAWLDMARAEDRRAVIRRAIWLVPAFLVFVIAPLIAGSSLTDYVPFAVGLAYGVPLLLMAARGRSWAPIALAGLVALELTVVGLVAQLGPIPGNSPDRLEEVASSGLGHSFPKFHAPFISPADYLTPGPIGQKLIQARGDYGRYLSLSPSIATKSPRGFLFHQDPPHWPAYENGRSILFGINEIQGYSPVQEDRYWRLVRFVDRTAPIFYNSATFQTINPELLRLFGVEWVIFPPQLSGRPGVVAREEGYSLVRLPHPAARASVVSTWLVVPPGTGLVTVARQSIDLVEDPRLRSPRLVRVGAAITETNAVYVESSPAHIRIQADAHDRALLVVRNAWDPNWRATVDGRPAKVLVADYMMQGVALPPGHHVVELTYRDTAIGTGLLVSGVAWLILLLGLGWAARRGLRGRPLGGPAV